MLEEFFYNTAWRMVTPRPYGAFHIIFMLAGLALAFVAAYMLRKTGKKGNRAVLLVTSLILISAELYKQLFYFFVVGGGQYQWWIFPFQLCSVPMYLCPLAALLPECKARKAIYDFMLSYNLMGGFVALLEPSGLVHEYWTLTLHAFVWHILLVFLGLYLWLSGRAGRSIRDFRYPAALYMVLAVVAFIFNITLAGPAKGDINMFFVGPRTSPIVVFETIAQNFGWYVCTPLFLFASSVAAFVIFALMCKIGNAKRIKMSGTDT